MPAIRRCRHRDSVSQGAASSRIATQSLGSASFIGAAPFPLPERDIFMPAIIALFQIKQPVSPRSRSGANRPKPAHRSVE
jgi:hypothetical protein